MAHVETNPLAVVFILASVLSAAAQGTDGPPRIGPVAPPPLPAEQPPPLPVAEWWIGENGKPVGPLTLQEIKARIAAKTLTPTTLVWKKGMPDWAPAEAIPELATLFAAAPNPPTPGPAAIDVTHYMLGTWEVSGAANGMSTKLTATFAADGTFTGTYVQSAGGAQNSAQIHGTWAAKPIAEKRFSLTMTVYVEGNPQGRTSTSSVTIIDDNSFRDDADGTITRRVSG